MKTNNKKLHFFRAVINFFTPKSLSKIYRDDIKMWEEKFIWLGSVSAYRYSKWAHPKPIVLFKCNRVNPKSAKTTPFKPLSFIKIGKKEFQEKYKGNKWIVPVNYELDLTRD